MTSRQAGKAIQLQRFENVPHTDFSRAENREEFQQALDEVRERFGEDYPLVINGKSVDSRSHLVSRNPSNKSEVLGKVASATVDQAEQAIESARRAWPEWRRIDPDHRAEYLELIAAGMRNRRFELAAWMVFESGKPWKEADADVAEAIDFCTYYALAMRELDAVLQVDYPGEENSLSYRPRGVAVVIAPWNFPLAILTGMTVAALVTGNTVIMKPAEQSSIIAAKLMEIIRDSGLPNGAVNFLPGIGEDIGPTLTGSPDVDLIAFTGSRDVGLSIFQQAAETSPNQFGIKQVIAELGGKNAMIIDNDADLDDAVQGVVSSAFNYAGQKCSACSRVIVLKDVYEAFVERLRNATESLTVGPADQPGIDYGPVIDEDAFERINDYIEIGKDECESILVPDQDLPEQGYFIGPHIFGVEDIEERLVQEEIFGPVLVVLKARNLDHAFTLANSTDYALTGGVYSRSPKTLQRAKEEFLVGNLYLNRNVTGALVQRHPFGGFRMSGIGSKAGGPDYLQQFMLPVSVSENTMRRGFAPPPDEEK